MKLEEAEQAALLVGKLAEGLDAQMVAIVDLKRSLDNYIVYLQTQIEELRDSQTRVVRDQDEI